jgi:hypothetical protein
VIKAYVDSNCYILYAQDKSPLFRKILNLEKNFMIKIFYQPNLKEELLRKPSVPKKEKLRIERNLVPLDYREKPFTIGGSLIGGPAYISRFSNRKEKPTDVTTQEIIEGVRKAMFSAKKSLGNSDNKDIEFYSEAVNLGCDYFITQNTSHFGKSKSKKRQDIENFDKRVKPICKIRTINEFLEEIAIVEEQTLSRSRFDKLTTS